CRRARTSDPSKRGRRHPANDGSRPVTERPPNGGRRAHEDDLLRVRREEHMATRLKPVDVVTVGVGWAGSILGKELAKAGLKVVGLERGDNRAHADFALPQ